MRDVHCVKRVCILGFSGLYFTAFGLNTGIYEINLRIQSKCGKIQTRKTPNTDTVYAMNISQLSFDLLFDSVLIQQNPGQRKPVFWYILRSECLDFWKFEISVNHNIDVSIFSLKKKNKVLSQNQHSRYSK